MRIITGTAKGKKLKTPIQGTRPLTDRIKTSIFDLVRDFIPNSNVLDLYAGSGSFGIEALSRGATSAIFVDTAKKAIDCIKENLLNTKLHEKAKVIKAKVNDFLVQTPEKFDLIFLDPPFADKIMPDFTRWPVSLQNNTEQSSQI
jgi:16S rRNA (guanine(966)-N(2))-methyltransferase RsmD